MSATYDDREAVHTLAVQQRDALESKCDAVVDQPELWKAYTAGIRSLNMVLNLLDQLERRSERHSAAWDLP